MNADSFLKTGKAHAMCQDYIISNKNYVILSDGCSGAENAEIGAMVLCLSAQNLFRMYLGQMDFKKAGELIIHNAEMAIRVLKGPKTCLDATLLLAVIFNETIYISIYGDGIVIWKDRNKHINYINVTFENERPLYLSHMLDPTRLNIYKTKKIQKTITSGKIVPDEVNLCSPITIVNMDSTTEYGLHLTFPVNMVEGIFISSDGLDSFKSRNGKFIPIESILKDILNFKTNSGEFIKRRMKRFIKEREAEGIFHTDDISFGGFIQEGINENKG